MLHLTSNWCKLPHDGIDDPMVFLTGPRQVGKTFWARRRCERYFNWDTPEVKKAFLKDPYFFRDMSASSEWVVLDEVHKRRDWKKLLKGYYDSPARVENFIVTGSGRFDQFRKGSDSLQGRYFLYQMWPLIFDEICALGPRVKLRAPRDFAKWTPEPRRESDRHLQEFGGFPAPFVRGSQSFLSRWREQYLERLTREDTRDFAMIQNLDKLEMLARLLPTRLSSPLSEKSLAEDVDVSPITIKSWLRLLEDLYLGFSVRPYSRRIHRSVKKERKWYFYQWTFAEEKGARFENYLAAQLGAVCTSWTEQGLGRWELYFLRDQDRREVDFLLANNLQPVCLIEAKSSPQDWPNGLKYYTKKLKVPGFLVYPEGPTRKHEQGFSLSSEVFLRGLVLG